MKKKKLSHRKVCKEITWEKLEEFLGKVGWSLRHHGCGHFRLYNPYGRCSAYMICVQEGHPLGRKQPLRELRIDEYDVNFRDFQRPFGKTPGCYFDHCGIQMFNLDRKNVFMEAVSWTYRGPIAFVSIVARDGDGKDLAWISFNEKFTERIAKKK